MNKLIASITASLVIVAIVVQLPEPKESINISESTNPQHTFTHSGCR